MLTTSPNPSHIPCPTDSSVHTLQILFTMIISVFLGRSKHFDQMEAVIATRSTLHNAENRTDRLVKTWSQSVSPGDAPPGSGSASLTGLNGLNATPSLSEYDERFDHNERSCDQPGSLIECTDYIQ